MKRARPAGYGCHASGLSVTDTAGARPGVAGSVADVQPGHDRLGTRELLLGLAREGEGVVARVL